MRIGLGSDHAGFLYKERLRSFLRAEGLSTRDFGTFSEAPVDYPVYVRPVAAAVSEGELDRGIVLGGSGNGEAIVANRVAGVRCAVCWNRESAWLARAHNDSNVLAIGQRLVPFDVVLGFVRVWLRTPFAGGRHDRRIRMIDVPPRRRSA